MEMTERENDILWKEYFYPGTKVLINYFDIKDKEKLKEVEASNSFDRLLELRDNPIDLGFGIEHLLGLHKYIFGDIYPFAGQLRKVNMHKDNHFFVPIEDGNGLVVYLNEVFEFVNKELMNCSSLDQFADLLARLYTDLIHCHPFREGNGRTIREFIREFSISKSKELGLGNYELDWKSIDKEKLDEYVDVAHIFPGATSIIFRNALSENNKVVNK